MIDKFLEGQDDCAGFGLGAGKPHGLGQDVLGDVKGSTHGVPHNDLEVLCIIKA